MRNELKQIPKTVVVLVPLIKNTDHPLAHQELAQCRSGSR